MKIIYFTGTGNCLSVAKHFNAELLSIPQMAKNNKYLIEDEVVGIIYPIYATSIPNIVRNYVAQCQIKADYVFVIATYGYIAGGSVHEMKKLLKSKGIKADYYNSLLMVDNYLPLFDIEKQLSLIKEKNTEKNIDIIVDEINKRIKKPENCGFLNNFITLIASKTISKIEKYTPKIFSVNNKCIGCGICKNICPASNIYSRGQKQAYFWEKLRKLSFLYT